MVSPDSAEFDSGLGDEANPHSRPTTATTRRA
jgi:hypothetical protein